MSSAIEAALQSVLQRPTEPVMLDNPIDMGQLPTPALVLDRATMSSNIRAMSEHLGAHGKGFRPHANTHKCPEIARQQMAAGAVGICTAKVSEAAVMVRAGIDRVLVTSPVSTPAKARVVNHILSPDITLLLAVDSSAGLAALAAAIDDDKRIGIVLDLDVSMGRTGLREDELFLRLLDQIEADPRFYFAGVQHYAGHIMHIPEFEKRREKSLKSWQRLADKFELLAARGVTPSIVTGGGTGTYDIDTTIEQLTDIQVGSYIFMDEEYRQVQGAGSDRFQGFELALTVACTAISQPQAATITVDGGYKAFASDSVNPVCDALPDVQFRFAGDEHGVLILPQVEGAGQNEAPPVQLGQVLEFAVPHCDPTVNLHDQYWIRETDGMVHSIWPISARGCSW
ncbi:MAG: DSD1 family PLP-dependent enzyme [Proteobacteria bacterium]|nr:DSD1 family PLP-dependent enzyme [Pseudomonadota bacterium]